MEATLTTHERHQLVTVLRELDRTAVKERRRHLRRKTLIHLWMQRINRGARQRFTEIVLVNVSAIGVGLLSPVACPKGERFVLPLPFVEGGGWLVLCEVRNCQRLANGLFKIGGRFVDKIEDEDGDAKVPERWRAVAKE